MFPSIFAWLKGDSDVASIVGTRIYEHQAAPQDPTGKPATQPYITWFVPSLTPENNLSDTPPTDRVSVQVDSWHTDGAGVKALATAVRNCLEPYGHMTGLVANLREPETRLYRVGLTFDIWLDRQREVSS